MIFARDDVRDFLGMRTRTGWLLGCLFMGSVGLLAATTHIGVTRPEIVAVAFVFSVLAGVGLMTLPGDPIPAKWAVSIVGAQVLSVDLLLMQMEIPPADGGPKPYLWPIACSAAIFTFLCARGAVFWAWMGLVALLISTSVWAVNHEMSVASGLGHSIVNVAPMLMATFFALIIRPTVRTIVELRAQANALAAAEGATVALDAERAVQLRALESTAAPMLRRLAAGGAIDDRMVTECRLLEAALRDQVRARAIVDTDVATSAWEARERGATVVLLDDSGREDDSPAPVRAAIADQLSQVLAGRVIVRLLPAGRDHVATIHAREDGNERSWAVNADGRVFAEP